MFAAVLVLGEAVRSRRALQLEQERSERLLLNVLPASIAARLKQREEVIADRFSDVTVLFADLVDFTRRSERITPEQLVQILNELFSVFDQVAQRHGLEKIKTVGDAYMVAGGLPEPRPDPGPAVAGVIGTSKFSYDLWGDTVNTASRMESYGVAGCIQVTARTYQRLKDGYRFERRGPIQVKGKGELVTYLL